MNCWSLYTEFQKNLEHLNIINSHMANTKGIVPRFKNRGRFLFGVSFYINHSGFIIKSTLMGTFFHVIIFWKCLFLVGVIFFGKRSLISYIYMVLTWIVQFIYIEKIC